MTISWREELPQWSVLVAMFVAALWSWPQLPDRLPVHWGPGGQVNRWGGKFEALFVLPLSALGLYILLILLPRIDPRRANYAAFARAYYVLRLSVLGLLAAVAVFMHLRFRGLAEGLEAVVMPLLMGLLMVILGGVMGKVRPNWFVGIRTPWTLSSETAWVRTHRLAAWLFVLAGLTQWAVMIVSPRWADRAVLPLLLGAALVPAAYSFFVWRTATDQIPPVQTLPLRDEKTPPPE
jgi:uncharacterized membrane protein